MRRVSPEVYLVAEPQVNRLGMFSYLTAVGGTKWLDTVAEAHTAPGERLTEFMGRLCYRSWEEGLNANVTRVRTDPREYFANLLKSKHGSVLEHANYSFVFHNVSRVFTHELVRHRAGCAYSQESLRFVRLTDLGLWMPADAPPWMVEMFERTYKDLEALQTRMAQELGLDAKGDDAMKFADKKKWTSMMRRLAPEGLATSIGMTVNVRAIRHILAMRTAAAAETEIAEVFRQVAKIMVEKAPLLFQDMNIGPDGAVTFSNEKV